MLSVSSQRKYKFYHQNALLDAFRTNSHNIIGRNLSMVIPLLTNQDLTPMLHMLGYFAIITVSLLGSIVAMYSEIHALVYHLVS